METSLSPVEKSAKFFTWAGMIPTLWEGTGWGESQDESLEVTVDFRLNELVLHWHHKAAVFCTTLGAAWLADLGKFFSLVRDTDEAA